MEKKNRTFTTFNNKEITIISDLTDNPLDNVYTCYFNNDPETTYVLKLRLKATGGMFKERNFYLRVLIEDNIIEFENKHNIILGVPQLISYGSVVINQEKYIFIIMDHYNRNISNKCYKKTAIDILYVLEFIHSHNFVHNDIKLENLVEPNNSNPVYVIDFGLVSKYKNNLNIHVTNEENNDFKEVGTREFLSRDAHIGKTSRRSDLETLLYNLVHWENELPWRHITDMEAIHNMKKRFVVDTNIYSPHLKDFHEYILSLSFEEEPNYNICRNFFM